MWIYANTEPGLWTVGTTDADGEWHTDSDHDNREDARRRVHYLNGGTDELLTARITELESELAYLRFFAGNADFGPAHTHVLMAIQAAYEATGAQVPETWRVE